MKYITARQFIKKYGISKLTLSNWRKANKVNFIKIGIKSYLYDPDIKTTKQENTLHIAYARVSNTKQSTDLESQEKELQNFVINQGFPVKTIKDIASGMNENRTGLNELLNLIMDKQVNTIYITYKDRLTRFGFDYFKNLFDKFGTKIVVLNDTEITPFETELTNDLVAIIHHFSMKLYSHRRTAIKNTEKALKEELLKEQK